MYRRPESKELAAAACAWGLKQPTRRVLHLPGYHVWGDGSGRKKIVKSKILAKKKMMKKKKKKKEDPIRMLPITTKEKRHYPFQSSKFSSSPSG